MQANVGLNMRCRSPERHQLSPVKPGELLGQPKGFPPSIAMSMFLAAGCDIKDAIGMKFLNVKYFDPSSLKLCQL